MLEAQDLQAIKEIMDTSIATSIAASEERMITRMDASINALEGRMMTRMEASINASEGRMMTRMETDIDASEERMISKMDVMERRISSNMNKRFKESENMILEHVDHVQVKLEKKIESLRDDTSRKILRFSTGRTH